MADPLAARRKRLMFQSLRRGTREGDFIVGGFAKSHLDSLDAGQLEKFDRLLSCNEPDLLAWVTGIEGVPPEHDHDVMALLVKFKSSLASN